MKKLIMAGVALSCLSACASRPAPAPDIGGLSLPDRVVYAQDDPKWADHRMGGSGETLKAEGCLVTATAMALTNLGFKMSPADFNRHLKKNKGYTRGGQLIWSGVASATDGGARAEYYDHVSDEIITGCLRAGYYPLARFILPNGRSHWAMIVRQSARGYHMRDPLHVSSQPLIFQQGVSGFKAIRCVGRA